MHLRRLLLVFCAVSCYSPRCEAVVFPVMTCSRSTRSDPVYFLNNVVGNPSVPPYSSWAHFCCRFGAKSLRHLVKNNSSFNGSSWAVRFFDSAKKTRTKFEGKNLDLRSFSQFPSHSVPTVGPPHAQQKDCDSWLHSGASPLISLPSLVFERSVWYI